MGRLRYRRGRQLQEARVVDEVVSATIGSEDCKQTIRQVLAKGADRTVRVWDDALGGVDLLVIGAKTEILSAVVEAEDSDLVPTGVQAGDDSFGAISVSLAEQIGYQWGAVVNHLEHDFGNAVAAVRRELEGRVEELTEIALLTMLTIQTGINEPRYASLGGIRQAQQKHLDVQSLGDLGVDESTVQSELGLTDMYEPESESDVTAWEGSLEETAAELGDLLREKRVAP